MPDSPVPAAAPAAAPAASDDEDSDNASYSSYETGTLCLARLWESDQPLLLDTRPAIETEPAPGSRSLAEGDPYITPMLKWTEENLRPP